MSGLLTMAMKVWESALSALALTSLGCLLCERAPVSVRSVRRDKLQIFLLSFRRQAPTTSTLSQSCKPMVNPVLKPLIALHTQHRPLNMILQSQNLTKESRFTSWLTCYLCQLWWGGEGESVTPCLSFPICQVEIFTSTSTFKLYPSVMLWGSN